MMSDPRLTGFGGINDLLNRFAEYRQYPKFTFSAEGAPVTIKLLRNGKNAGGASIEYAGSWCGYIRAGSGALEPSRQASALPLPQRRALWTLLQELRDAPKDTFAAHGHASGVCCLCGRFLSDPESVAAGMGPVCAARAWGA